MRDFIRHIPNTLTVFRMVLVPVYVVLIEADYVTAALFVFIVAGVTDGIDGFIARRYDARSEFGATMDPIADKLLMITAFIVLSYKGWVPLYLCGLAITRDVFILTGFVALKSSGKAVKISPSIAGKLTTFLQIVTVVAAMLLAGEPSGFYRYLVYATTLITFVSGIHYAYVGLMLFKR